MYSNVRSYHNITYFDKMDYPIYRVNNDHLEFNCILDPSRMISVRNGSEGVYAIGVVISLIACEVVKDWEECTEDDFKEALRITGEKIESVSDNIIEFK